MDCVRRLLAGAILAVLPGTAASGQDAQPVREEQPRQRDAAEVVQEGNVTNWLEYYQRERGATWSQPKDGAATPGSANHGSTPPTPAPADE